LQGGRECPAGGQCPSGGPGSEALCVVTGYRRLAVQPATVENRDPAALLLRDWNNGRTSVSGLPGTLRLAPCSETAS
jgi:hypothetical protein